MKCENCGKNEGQETYCRVCMENDGKIVKKVLCDDCIDQNIADAKEIIGFKDKQNNRSNICPHCGGTPIQKTGINYHCQYCDAWS